MTNGERPKRFSLAEVHPGVGNFCIFVFTVVASATIISSFLTELVNPVLHTRGEVANYKANPGSNSLRIELKAVNGTDVADVVISVVIPSPTPPTPTPIITPSPAPSPTPAPTLTPTPSPFSWDGKSFQNSGKWRIEVVP